MADVNTPDADLPHEISLRSRGYHITIEEGEDAFFALCIEDPDREEAWIISDTVHALDGMR